MEKIRVRFGGVNATTYCKQARGDVATLIHTQNKSNSELK